MVFRLFGWLAGWLIIIIAVTIIGLNELPLDHFACTFVLVRDRFVFAASEPAPAGHLSAAGAQLALATWLPLVHSAVNRQCDQVAKV